MELLSALYRIAAGGDTGWRVGAIHSHLSLIDINVFSGTVQRLALKRPDGSNLSLKLRQAAVGIPLGMEERGLSRSLQSFRPSINKVRGGIFKGRNLDESDIRGAYRSISLGQSPEGSENITIIFFGDWATGLSMGLAWSPQFAIAAQIFGATAAAVIPTGPAGCHFALGHCW